MRLIEKPGKSEFLNLEARKRVLKAYKKLNSPQTSKRSNAPWHSTSNKIEKIFKKNLKTRIAPAFKNDTISPTYLLDVACALRGNDISLLDSVNTQLRNQLDEILEEDKAIAKYLSLISSSTWGKSISKYVSLTLSSTLGMGILTFIMGFILSLSFIFVLTRIFNLNFIQIVKDNVVGVSAICIAAFLTIFQMFRKKK